MIAAAPQRILWLGAYGTGTSAEAAGRATRTLLATFMLDEAEEPRFSGSIALALALDR